MRFVDPGIGTVNEQYLLEALAHHGRLVASGREVCYRKEFGPRDERFIGDAFALFMGTSGVASLVGIEIKDWAAPVTPKLAVSYLKVYGRSCDFVYLAARRFLPGVFRVPKLGLLSLEGPNVIRRAERLDPDEEPWRFVIGKLSNPPVIEPLHPRQRTLPVGPCDEEFLARETRVGEP
jgi:hypothetical protein